MSTTAEETLRPAAPPALGTHRFLQLVLWDLRRGVAGSIVGIGWMVLTPLAFLLAYLFLLEVLRADYEVPAAGSRTLAVLSGLACWLVLRSALSQGIASMRRFGAPLRAGMLSGSATAPLVVGAVAIELLIGLLVLAPVALFDIGAEWQLLLLVPAALMLVLLALIMAWALGPLDALVPDLRRFVPIALRMGLVISPVLYLPAQIPSSLAFVAYANPASYFISLYRYACFGDEEVAMITPALDYAVCAGILVLLAAVAYRMQRRFGGQAIDLL